MKKYFITGLIILLPLALTIAIVAFVFNFLTTPFIGLVKNILHYFGLLDTNFFFIPAQQLQIGVSKVVILLLLFFFTVFLGIVGRWFIIHYLLKMWDYLIHKIPFVNKIYKTCQDIIQTLFTSKTNAFKQVVMVPFPTATTYSIGLLTRDTMPGIPSGGTDNFVAVFVPTTPNPTSGFLIMFREQDILYMDMSVEDAFKFVISCGVIASPMKTVTKEEALNLRRPVSETTSIGEIVTP